jgi:2-polyprenyl-3-methyl-5-hydroxy-6-metoxy-1,4-benzoquinol methylase
MSWTENFFGKYYLKTHLPVLTEEKTIEETDFIEEALKLTKGASILDVPCGHGRHSIQLARRGYNVTGVDIQPDFIALARENSQDIENLNFMVEDMRKISYENEFDAVINLFTSFGYFSEAENFYFLKAMVKSLKKGGKLLIDTVNREWAMNNTGTISQAWLVYPPDNIAFLANNSFNVYTSRMISDQAIIDNGERYVQQQDIRLYTYTEMNTLLKLNGMEITAVYGNVYQADYSASTTNMIIVAEKK